MTLRTRIALISATAVALAIVLASVVSYVGTRNELLDEVDRSLVDRAELIIEFPQALRSFGQGLGGRGAINPLLVDPLGRSGRGFDALYFQLVISEGNALVPSSQGFGLPVEDIDLTVANGESGRVIRTVALDDGAVRMITEPFDGGALQLARSLDEVDATLGGLSTTLWLTGLLGVLIAGGLGLLVARSALRPVAALTNAAEHVAETKELAAHIDVDRTDELGRLAVSFNAMLDALQSSRAQQHRLVRDASHELRTPLTALRTNIEVLAKQEDMAEVDRQALLDDVKFEVEQLTALVTELVDLATESETEERIEPVALGEVAAEVAARYRRRSGHPIGLQSDETVVAGRRSRLERAISNLVDNAVKWSPDEAPIDITVGAGRVSVRDQGAGIAARDAERVFDRFYRADTARTMPGSGLGLSIVKQIAETHGGTVFVDHPDDGGVTVGFELPEIAG